MFLTVADVTDVTTYVLMPMPVCFELRVRGPDHRLLRPCRRDVHLHLYLYVYGLDRLEVRNYLDLPDWLRTDRADRALFAEPKRRPSSNGAICSTTTTPRPRSSAMTSAGPGQGSGGTWVCRWPVLHSGRAAAAADKAGIAGAVIVQPAAGRACSSQRKATTVCERSPPPSCSKITALGCNRSRTR